MQKLISTVSLRTFAVCATIGAGVALGQGTASAQAPDAPSIASGADRVTDPHALAGQFVRALNTGSSGLCLPFATGSNAGTPGCG
ncbi:hypothetical protein NBRGN_099_00340 [Nocardia brasiliensis NBRC 14402]|uniref:hypothetical protein n=1 Tax=Nocardia brasiliensis TaxID=37326 RepID=UPI00045C605A|nr:hypothetical protein [Nocardia brasiliensis]ASF08538.1 hypothetical protein CEQ30_15490 [Nocardia brasiliensis]GAJ85811.1 hypothetical protein NBRGN_099_00340 [Nocardia brasiliensis NBRC 14402]SUB40967.1 Uncharacterised protein [Nocardia brasiliensis]